MPITTQSVTLTTISAAELARANQALIDVSARDATISQQAGTISSLQALVASLQTQLDAVLHPPAPPVTPVPPISTRKGLYVDGAALRTKSGAAVVIRGVELMVGQDVNNRGFGPLLADLKAIGANAVSPLFQGSFGAVATVKAFCDAARALGLIVGVNADHQSNGRVWLTAAPMVALLNSYDHVFLECEVETDQTTSSATWAADAKGLVAALRAAGHIHPIKVGAPVGGRMVKHPLAKGAEVLAADPLKNVCFTWQAYWKKAIGGWQYAEDNGFAAGIAGSKAAIAACASSGLHFVVGLDWQDDVGETGVPELSAEADRLGVSYQYWVLFGDGMYPTNNLMSSWQLTNVQLTSTATAVGALLRVKSAPAAL
jgi:hypothetical protein